MRYIHMKIIKQTIWKVVERVTLSTLVERLEKSGGNIHCMTGLYFVETVQDDDICEFYNSWAWIQHVQQTKPNKKLYVIEEIERHTMLS